MTKKSEATDSIVEAVVEKQHRMTQKVLVVGLYLFKALLVILIIWFGFKWLGKNERPPQAAESIVVEVKQGQSRREIAEELTRKQVLSSKYRFLWLTYLNSKPLQVGLYQFEPNQPVKEVYRKITQGEVYQEKVTIPEGWRREQIAQLLQSKNLSSYESFLSLSEGLEGKLFPDTYYLAKNSQTETIIKRMLANYESKTNSRPLTEEQLIIASIVEREAKKDADRALMAGVFYNRLKSGMRLEADPTVQYALDSSRLSEETADSIKDFKFWQPLKPGQARSTVSFYNTYRIAALPPGPICNPGLKSLQAALNPASTDYFYFVNTKDGQTVYAKTYSEHLENIQKYQIGN